MMSSLAPVPAPRTPKGREVARTNLEAASAAENKTDLSRLERILMASRKEDLNLAALISAVERDIWYMEQLESNPSSLRRKNSPDELPFPITDELLKLPGYKPRLAKLEQQEASFPELPPKSRQRRHSDSVATLTDSGSSIILDAPQERKLSSPAMMPRRPAPDPPSSETSFESDSESSVLKRLNCPLCVQTFGYSFGLECHVLSVHQDDLQLIRDGGHLSLNNSCYGCLCCAAQFFKLDILVRHIIEFHKDFLISSLNHGREFLLDHFQDSFGASLKRHFDCQFCGQKFLRRHLKLFLAHLEQRHVQDLEVFLQDSDMVLVNVSNIENIEVKLLHSLSLKVRIVQSTPPAAVSAKRRSVSAQRVKSDRNPMLDQSLVNDHQYMSPMHLYEVIASPPPIIHSNSTLSTMKRIKKRLKRSESNHADSSTRRPTRSPVTRTLTYQGIPQPDPNSDDDKRTSTSSSNPDVPTQHLFKCNLCEIAFAENAFLLTHLKNKHRSTVSRALRPQFSCGACPAKFFKNSFLVKHCECHGYNHPKRLR